MSRPRSAFARCGSAFGHDAFEVVGDVGEVGGGGRVCALVWRLEGEFGLLGAKIFEARLQARQALFAAFG